MENKEYTPGQNRPGRRGGMRGPGMGRGPAEKASDFKGTWSKLILYCKSYLTVVIIALICAAGGTVLTLLGPDKLSEMTKEIGKGLVTGVDMDAVSKIGFTLIAFYVCGALLSFGQQWIMATVTQNISKKLRGDISGKINRLPMSYYSRSTTGDILSRVTNDVDTISQSMNQSIGNLVSAVTLFVGSLFMMFKTDVIMTITAIVATLIGFVLMTVIAKHSSKYFVRQQRCLGEINGHIEEIYTGHTVVKAYNGEAQAAAEFERMNNNLRESAFRAQCLAGLMPPIMTFIGNLGYVAVCVAGAVLTMKGTIGFEVIVAFMMYVRYFTQPLSQIAQAAQSLQSAAAAGERVFEFLEAKEMDDESNKTKTLDDVKGDVSFEHVKFGYDEDRVIIHDFSAKAKAGQKIAIVGPTGAGKTTLVNLLMRFYEIQGGKICIDGIPTNQVKREMVHSQFCMVLQDTWLFEGTIGENIGYAEDNMKKEKIVEAAKSACAHSFIKTLPGGYDMTLSKGAENISQGERQLLTIARAIASDPEIMILDEATSNVDTHTEVLIQKAMAELMKGRTSFVIAHRLSTIRDADMILYMEDGDIKEVGNHEELMKKNGKYAALYMSQFA